MNRQLIRSVLFYLIRYDGLSSLPHSPGYMLVHYWDEQVDDEQGEGEGNGSGQQVGLAGDGAGYRLQRCQQDDVQAHDEQRRFAAGAHETGQRRAVALGIGEEGKEGRKEGKELDQREYRPLDRQVLHGEEQRQPEECHEVSV